jgi:hypothetical protein
MYKAIKVLLVIAILIILPAIINQVCAQPPPPTPSGAPIDGGAGILLVVGVYYSVRKIFKSNKK